MEFKYGVPGNTGSRGGFKGKNITSYLKEILEEQDKETGQPKNKLIAARIVEMALDKKISGRDFLAVVQEIMDRLEGKPVQTNLNADMAPNPFAGFTTDELEMAKQSVMKHLEEVLADRKKPE